MLKLYNRPNSLRSREMGVKAVQVAAFGNPMEVAQLVDIPAPDAPAKGEVLIDVEASPINPSDLFMMTGRYGYRPELPAVMGAEGVGTVSAVGDEVGHLSVGDRVLVPYQTPCWTEQVIGRADWLDPLPQDVDVHQLAMFGINPATAYLMLKEYVELQPGEWVIQNAANSAVGRSVIVVTKMLGLRTVNIVRREELIDELTAVGGDVVVIDGPDLAKRVRAATEKAQIRLGIEVVGDRAMMSLMTCLAPGAVVANYGAVSNRPFAALAPHLIFSEMSIRGFWLVHWFKRAKPQEVRDMYAALLPLMKEGKFDFPIAGTFALADAEKALVEAAKGSGKVLLDMTL